VAGSVAGERVVTENGVTIIGYSDLPSRLPQQASQLFGTNMVNLLKLLTPEKDGNLVIDFDDVVQRAVTVVQAGEITWPPPPVQVSAAPPAAAVAEVEPPKPKKTMSRSTRAALIGLGLVALLAITTFAPEPLPQNFLVLTLSVVVGFYVIGKVHHALHTPLMSVTNAISGIVVIGAIAQLGVSNLLVQVIAAIAVLFASINVFGGFAVTRRMLAMFSKGAQQ
jgi:NAD(P) transhydrogenase subunit alpha